MTIGDNHFTTAVKIISSFKSQCTVSFNVPINDNYSNVYPILIKQCAPGLVNELLANGFVIGVCEKGAYVERY